MKTRKTAAALFAAAALMAGGQAAAQWPGARDADRAVPGRRRHRHLARPLAQQLTNSSVIRS